jgi:hypothetical protein
MANPCCCCFIYHLGAIGMHQHCNFLDLEVRFWPSSSQIIRCAEFLCHLNTALQPKASLQYPCLIIWYILLVNLPNFWQNMMFFHYSNCNILNFHFLQTTTLHNSDFLNTPQAYKCLLGWSDMDVTILWLHVSTVGHNSTTMQPVQKIGSNMSRLIKILWV